jgi:DNA-binding NarL/FixJ family response regulator
VTRPAVRVLVAASYPAMRAGIRLVLEENGFEVVAEASDGKSAAAAAMRERPEICLVHINLDGDGIAAAALVKDRAPATATIVLARVPDVDELVDALRAGASGYVPESAGADGIARAVDVVCRGDPAIPRELLGALAEEFRARGLRRRVSRSGRAAVELTRRQSEVLELLRQGLSTAEIAARLRIAPVTVRRHVGLALGKLAAEDRAAAMRMLDESEGSSRD